VYLNDGGNVVSDTLTATYTQSDETLIFWLSFEDNWQESGLAADQSGDERHMLRYGFAATPTNWPSRVSTTNPATLAGSYAAEFTPYYDTPEPHNTNYHVGDYGAVTNIGPLGPPDNPSGLTQMTVAAWAYYYAFPESGVDQNCRILDASYGWNSYQTNCGWSFGRSYNGPGTAYQTKFQLKTNYANSQHVRSLDFGDDFSSTGQSDAWHHYLATVDVLTSNMIAYLDGVAVHTNTFTNREALALPVFYTCDYSWLGVGAMPHIGSPEMDDEDGFPNAMWMHGQLDDIRIYNRILTANEIATLADYTPPSTTNITRMQSSGRVQFQGRVSF
jgi:hypothetical protein